MPSAPFVCCRHRQLQHQLRIRTEIPSPAKSRSALHHRHNLDPDSLSFSGTLRTFGSLSRPVTFILAALLIVLDSISGRLAQSTRYAPDLRLSSVLTIRSATTARSWVSILTIHYGSLVYSMLSLWSAPLFVIDTIQQIGSLTSIDTLYNHGSLSPYDTLVVSGSLSVFDTLGVSLAAARSAGQTTKFLFRCLPYLFLFATLLL